MSKLEYRPDVDGLRTIAVLPVVLFHFGVSVFSGGFVGVDVFFVISGYLITRLILHEIDEGTFSFARFYERRARRLFPAMFVTVVVSLVAGQFLLFSEYLTQAAGSAIFAVTSLSNVFFWTQSGYFDTDALTKPLLHTWSLSVEEQFYLVWPAALLFLAPRFGRVGVLVALVAAGLISLFGAEYIMQSDPSAAFYLTPFRIVEFAIGAGVLWIERFVAARRLLLEASLLAGLALIGYAVFTYTEETAFPGFATLLPGFGTALAIAGGRAPLAGLILRNRVSVWIGLISYSVYLVHWPLAAYFDAYFLREPSLMEQIVLVASTLAIAAVMYRFVETPFRKPAAGRRLSGPAFGLVCALLALLVVVPASVQWSSREEDSGDFAAMTRNILSIPLGLLGATPAYGQEPGMISADHLDEMDSERSHLLRAINCGKDVSFCGAVVPGKTNVVVIGDSHAADGYNMLVSAYPDLNVMVTRSQGCPPFDEPNNDAACSAENEQRNQLLASMTGIDYIFIQVRVTPSRAPRLAGYVKDLVALGYKVVVVGASPLYDRELPDLYRRTASASNPFPDFSASRDDSSYEKDAEIKAAADEVGAVFLGRQDFFCPDGVCSDYTPSKQDLISIDRHHLSWGAAREFGEYVKANYPELFAN